MSERIMWIGGSHPRHLSYINRIMNQVDVGAGVMQVREDIVPEPPVGLPKQDHDNFVRHFKERDEAEARYFGDQDIPFRGEFTEANLLKVDSNTLNSVDTVKFVKKFNPDLVLIFGTGMIREPLMSALPKDTINLHLGLSPRYRGAATLFWPFYNLEPQFAGVTFHYIVHTPDGGDIIHQVTPRLERADGIHDVACKAVIQASVDAVAILRHYPDWETFSQKPEAGKNYLASDFKPQHLRMIYQEFDNDIVRAYLDGEIKGKKPQLKRQF